MLRGLKGGIPFLSSSALMSQFFSDRLTISSLFRTRSLVYKGWLIRDGVLGLVIIQKYLRDEDYSVLQDKGCNVKIS